MHGADREEVRCRPGHVWVLDYANIGVLCVHTFVAAPSRRAACSPNDHGLVRGADGLCLACHHT